MWKDNRISGLDVLVGQILLEFVHYIEWAVWSQVCETEIIAVIGNDLDMGLSGRGVMREMSFGVEQSPGLRTRILEKSSKGWWNLKNVGGVTVSQSCIF